MIKRNSYRGLRVRKKFVTFVQKKEADYKDVDLLNRFISDQERFYHAGLPEICQTSKNFSYGNKRAREISLLPFVNR